MGVDVHHDEDRVGFARRREGGIQVLRIDEDRVVVAPVDREVSQLTQCRVIPADLVEAGQERREG